MQFGTVGHSHCKINRLHLPNKEGAKEMTLGIIYWGLEMGRSGGVTVTQYAIRSSVFHYISRSITDDYMASAFIIV